MTELVRPPSRAMERGPIGAFTLSLIGLAFQAVGAIFTNTIFHWWGGSSWGPGMMMGSWMMGGSSPGMMMMGSWMMGGSSPLGYLWFALSAVFTAMVIALGVLGILWMNTADLSRVRTGSTLVLVASVIAFPTMFGFVLGSLLMFIGAILGLTWQPTGTKGG